MRGAGPAVHASTTAAMANPGLAGAGLYRPLARQYLAVLIGEADRSWWWVLDGGWIMLLVALARPTARCWGWPPSPDFARLRAWKLAARSCGSWPPAAGADLPNRVTTMTASPTGSAGSCWMRGRAPVAGAKMLQPPVRLIHGQRDEDVPGNWRWHWPSACADDVEVQLVKPAITGQPADSQPVDLQRLNPVTAGTPRSVEPARLASRAKARSTLLVIISHPGPVQLQAGVPGYAWRIVDTVAKLVQFLLADGRLTWRRRACASSAPAPGTHRLLPPAMMASCCSAWRSPGHLASTSRWTCLMMARAVGFTLWIISFRAGVGQRCQVLAACIHQQAHR